MKWSVAVFALGVVCATTAHAENVSVTLVMFDGDALVGCLMLPSVPEEKAGALVKSPKKKKPAKVTSIVEVETCPSVYYAATCTLEDLTALYVRADPKEMKACITRGGHWAER